MYQDTEGSERKLCQRPINQNKLYIAILTSDKLVFKGKVSQEIKKKKLLHVDHVQVIGKLKHSQLVCT